VVLVSRNKGEKHQSVKKSLKTSKQNKTKQNNRETKKRKAIFGRMMRCLHVMFLAEKRGSGWNRNSAFGR